MNPLADRLAEACRLHRDAPALDDGEERLSYRELLATAVAVTRALEAARIRAGEPVPVAVSNRARDLAAFLGVWRAGGVVVPVHRASTAQNAAAMVAKAGARVVVNGRPDLAAAGPLGTRETVAVLGVAPPPPRPLLEAAALVVLTSGSTGEPKGAAIAAGRLSAKLDMIDAEVGVEPGVAMLLPLQLTFSFGQWVSLLTLLKGGRLVLRARFDPAAILADLERERVQRTALVPTMIRALLPLLEAGAGRGWRGAVMAGGEPLPESVGRRLRTACPAARLGDIYGLTETGTSDFFVPPKEYDDAAGTIGRAGRGIGWRIAADGELQIRSPFAMLGYLDAPEMTAAAFSDGYFRTGDLARVNADGRVALIGRAKEVILRAGNKVPPMEVERVFLAHPGIHAALATGLPDDRIGETIHLLVVPKAGMALDPARLRDWAAERIERWKLPDRIHLGSALPAGRTGKADRRALARAIRDGAFSVRPEEAGAVSTGGGTA